MTISTRYPYATRLNSFKRGTVGTVSQLLHAVTGVPGLSAVEVNYPQHLGGESTDALAHALADTGLALTAFNLRYDDPDFAQGAFTNPNPTVREKAIQLTRDAVDAAVRLGVPHVILWMGQDGYDYPFHVDYQRLWEDEVDGFRQVADHHPSVRVSVEFKPSDPRRYALIRSMGDSLLAVHEVDRPNFGVTLDFCHVLMAGEHPGFAASLALRAGKLFGVHLNDGFGSADDGLIVGSVHPWHTLELLDLLRRHGWQGTIYFDTFPERVDPAAECASNIAAVETLLRVLDRLDPSEIDHLRHAHDAVGLQNLLREAAYDRR